MRTFVEPPPSSRCNCGGELRIKHIEATDGNLGLDSELFVCANCDQEQSYAVSRHNRTGGRVNDNILRAQSSSIRSTARR